MTWAFYKNLYSSEGTTNIEQILSQVPRKVTDNMNAFLCRPFTEVEVKEALFQMSPLKAPGPDGYPAHFFQRNWDICGDDITRTVLEVLNGDEWPGDINSTFIVLIPKVPNPASVGQFRPISLCNVVYKIISKVLANRLKIVLPDIISKEQSAFVSGRIISDNIIVAYECLHFMRTNGTKRNGHCALKLDMSKAYDRVEWHYLFGIMERLGFRNKWIDLIRKCVTTASFSIIFNGKPLEKFKPSRGIRQGDPISPYLFLLCAEGLSCLLNKNNDKEMGIVVANNAPKISHLLFADDSLLFFKADASVAEEIEMILSAYCDASGQRINYDKSSILFTKKCSDNLKEVVKRKVHVFNEALTERYMGLPTDVGRSKGGAFKYLKDQVWKRVQGWMEQSLSDGGKEVLIKAVAQAVPTYSMGYFRLPRGLCQALNAMIQKFWWGSKEGKRKTCWVPWEKMTQPKYLGGLGFRDFELFNLALLARQAWRILQYSESLSARMLKAIYFPNEHFLSAALGSRPSQMWRAILDGRDVLEQGLIRRIGNGEDT